MWITNFARIAENNQKIDEAIKAFNSKEEAEKSTAVKQRIEGEYGESQVIIIEVDY